MPETGFIVFWHNEPVAAVFLRLVEGFGGQVDGLTSNPKAPAKLRNDCIDAALAHLIERSKVLELKQLLAFSVDDNTLQRANRLGFKPIVHKAVILDLTV